MNDRITFESKCRYCQIKSDVHCTCPDCNSIRNTTFCNENHLEAFIAEMVLEKRITERKTAHGY